ncbi:MAG: hypothetical protein ACYCVH_00430 [Ignavibacteriaceae bacterium]
MTTMNYNEPKHEWTKKDGSLSDKTASKEFGLTQNDIINAINEGKLQFREGSIYGNPFSRHFIIWAFYLSLNREFQNKIK